MKKRNAKKYDEPIMEVLYFDLIETIVTSTLEQQVFPDTENDIGSWKDWMP